MMRCMEWFVIICIEMSVKQVIHMIIACKSVWHSIIVPWRLDRYMYGSLTRHDGSWPHIPQPQLVILPPDLVLVRLVHCPWWHLSRISGRKHTSDWLYGVVLNLPQHQLLLQVTCKEARRMPSEAQCVAYVSALLQGTYINCWSMNNTWWLP